MGTSIRTKSRRRLGSGEIEGVLRANHPRVCRMALGLCGDQAVGNRAVKTVILKSLHAMPWCESEAEARNWFAHHTVLTCREMSGKAPEASEDVLVRVMTAPPPGHIAFVKALRNLPGQQMEAFLLLRGEHFDPRAAAVAMDCSTGAVANHHIAATKALTEIAGDDFEERVAELMRAYASLSPAEEVVLRDVDMAGRRMQRRRVWRFVKTIVQLAMLGAIGWIGWKIWKMIIV